MADALFGALGKPGSPLKLVMIGTLAPMATAAGHWWYDLIAGGTNGTTHVTAFRGDPAKWARWSEIRKCNPLTAISPEFRAKLLSERDAARRDSRLKARYLSYRLNIPTAETSTVLLTVDEWKTVTERLVPPRKGRPVVGIDLGGGRAWSAAVALWPNGRVEALAVGPGSPSIEDQEKRDRVPRRTYRRLVDRGVLTTDGDRRVPRVSVLVDRAMAWRPKSITCDRFRLSELQDAVLGRCPVLTRIARWSDASADIRSARRIALDGPLSVTTESRDLLAVSMAAAKVEGDTSGNSRLVKRSTHNTGRDDVAVALVLAAGAHSRRRRQRAGVVRSCLVAAAS